MLLNWWHPNGVLYEKYGHKLVYDAGNKVDAKLSECFKRENLVLATRVVSIQSKLSMVNIGELDQPVQKLGILFG